MYRYYGLKLFYLENVRKFWVSLLNLLQWVSDYAVAEIRDYSRLFTHKCPEDAEQVSLSFYILDLWYTCIGKVV